MTPACSEPATGRRARAVAARTHEPSSKALKLSLRAKTPTPSLPDSQLLHRFARVRGLKLLVYEALSY
jgi:hypothetical protein